MQLWHVGRVAHRVPARRRPPVAPTAMPVPAKAFIPGENGQGILPMFPIRRN
jgi:N-ethylmaleimide reductase